jgi:hypothetical protein
MHNGPIPPGLYVLHHCDVCNCVRPDHLFLGTSTDNMCDKEAKGRGNHPRGERQGSAKLTEALVQHIRAWYATGDWKQLELAMLLDIHPVTIHNIIHNRTWKHVTTNNSAPVALGDEHVWN